MARFLILDGYPKFGREALVLNGSTQASLLYQDMLLRYRPEAEIDIAYPADPDCNIPDLDGYDAMLWTGSSLTIFDAEPEVTRQIELAREGYQRGLKAFGSCWALQLAAVAAGGECRRNPKGREFGLTQNLRRTQAGCAHPLLAARIDGYRAFTSHFDEVCVLPDGGTSLVSNDATTIQAAEIHHEGGSFFGLQYHPEFNYGEIAGLARARGEGLLRDNFFENAADLQQYIEDCLALNEDRDDAALRQRLGAADEVIDARLRHQDFINWLDFHNL